MTQEQAKIIQSRRQRPGFFRRFFRALLKTLLILVIAAGLVAAGYFIFQELRRSYDVLNGRIDRQNEQFIDLQDQLKTQADQLKTVQLTVSDLDENLAGNLDELRAAVSDDVTHQDEMLVALTKQVAGLITETQTMTQTIILLNDGQSALQQDVIAINGDLDAQGGEFDNLLGELEALQTGEAALADRVAAFETELTAADPAGLRQAVLIFRLWELVTRARLRLVEHNLGLAEDDVQLALAALSDLTVDSPEAMVEPWQQIEQRLLMAADNLPDTPLTAANDLDIAWQELDAILSAILGLEPVSIPTPEPTTIPTP